MDMMNNAHGDLSSALLGSELKFVTMWEKMSNGAFTALIGSLAFYMGHQYPAEVAKDETVRKEKNGKSQDPSA